MAKKRRKSNFSQVQRERFGTDLEALGLTSLDFNEVRFDPNVEGVKDRLEVLSRYGIVKIRIHGANVWRVALTDVGRDIAGAHERKMARQRERGLTGEQEEERHERKNQRAAVNMLSGEKDRGGIEEITLPPDPILVTTQTLRAFQSKALEKDYSRVLTDEVLESLLPNVKHKVILAWKHTSFEGYRNIRVQVEIHVKDVIGKNGDDTRRVICDISNRDWEMLMVPHINKTRRSSIVPENDSVLYMAAPDWAAVRSFPVVHELHSFYQGHAAAYLRTGWLGPFSVPNRFGRWGLGGDNNLTVIRGDAALDFIQHPRTVMNAAFCEQLQTAHPVIIDPEWVEIQEDWGLNEAWAYAERVVLPFDPLYLDFEGPGGSLPMVTVDPDGEMGEVKMELAGCLFFTDWQTGRLVVVPVGGRQWLDLTLQTGILAGGYPYEQVGSMVFGGRCQTGQTLDGVHGTYIVPANMDTLMTNAVAVDLLTYQEQAALAGPEQVPEVVEEPWKVPGYVYLPLTPDEALRPVPNDDIAGGWIHIWGRVVRKLAAKSLSILSLLDNENVEIRDAELPRQQRRQIERDRQKGRERGVASEIVVIRKTRYVNGKKVDSDHSIEYSHQWRVRRHEQHHGPHTPVYQAKPWLAKPCGRCGSCRRFIIESYIKGPADKPLKDHKTYKFQDPED